MIEQLYERRMELISDLSTRCVCISDTLYKQRCWGCSRCWNCVDKADAHYCIECCRDDIAVVKAIWECRTKPSIECLMQIPGGDYGALVLACHQAEVTFRAMNPDHNDKVMRDAIRSALIASELLYDHDHAGKLAEIARLILNTIKHDIKPEKQLVKGQFADAKCETVRIAPRLSFGFLTTSDSASRVDGEVQPPTERKHQLGLFTIVCELCKGLDRIFSEEPPFECADTP